MDNLDFRPRVVFHTSAGALVVLVDPASFIGGSVDFPGIGTVPYDINYGTQTMILHFPQYGDVPINLVGGEGPSVVTIPGVGDIPYEITIGEPDIPYEGRVTVPRAALLTGLNLSLPFLLLGGAIILGVLARPRR